MRLPSAVIACVLGMLVLCATDVVRATSKLDETLPEGISAVQAVAVANEWKWTKKDVKSYINSSEIVFEFPDGKAKRIALPKDKMFVAVAPYMKQTHT